MKIRKELLKIKNGFGSASGILYEKPIFILELKTPILNESEWEITYSPSMGTSINDMITFFNNISKNLEQQKNPIVIKNHLKWIEWIKSNFLYNKFLNQKTIKGVQYSLTEKCVKVDEGVDFLRIKAKKNIPSWIFSLEVVPKILIIDYNGSGNEKIINKDLVLIRKKFKHTNVYLEQPFKNIESFKTLKNVNYIFDTADIKNLVNSLIIRENDIVSLKLGRNTPEEYEMLRSKNINICFGNVNSGILGERICSKISEQFSTINLKIRNKETLKL